MTDSVIHRPALIGPDDVDLPPTQPLDISEIVHEERPEETTTD